MTSNRSFIIYHVVFTTEDRVSWLNSYVRPQLFAYMGGVTRRLGGDLIAAGGIADHGHLMPRLPPTMPISTYVGKVKGASSAWLKATYPSLWDFHWQQGYFATSVSPSSIAAVQAYIDNQEVHHLRQGTEEEIVALEEKIASGMARLTAKA